MILDCIMAWYTMCKLSSASPWFFNCDSRNRRWLPIVRRWLTWAVEDKVLVRYTASSLTSSTWLMQGNGAGVRKCLLFGLRNIISTVLSLLIVSLLRLDQSSRWPTSVATSTEDLSATSKVVSSAYLIILLILCLSLVFLSYVIWTFHLEYKFLLEMFDF